MTTFKNLVMKGSKNNYFLSVLFLILIQNAFKNQTKFKKQIQQSFSKTCLLK